MRLRLCDHTLEAVLFDFDGTLIDASEAILASFSTAFRRQGLPEPRRLDVLRLIGYPLGKAFAALAPESEVPGLVEVYRRDFWDRSRNGTRLLPGAEPLLRHLARHVPVGIVSSRSRRGISDLLDHFNLADSVAVVVAVDDVERSKPHPEPILAALSSLRLGVAGVAMVGDTPLDIAAARAAGVLAVGVATGIYDENQLREAGADLLVRNLSVLGSRLGLKTHHERGLAPVDNSI
jgi:HAD superfamily hydrolase (TIGR01509 family)